MGGLIYTSWAWSERTKACERRYADEWLVNDLVPECRSFTSRVHFEFNNFICSDLSILRLRRDFDLMQVPVLSKWVMI